MPLIIFVMINLTSNGIVLNISLVPSLAISYVPQSPADRLILLTADIIFDQAGLLKTGGAPLCV